MIVSIMRIDEPMRFLERTHEPWVPRRARLSDYRQVRPHSTSYVPAD